MTRKKVTTVSKSQSTNQALQVEPQQDQQTQPAQPDQPNQQPQQIEVDQDEEPMDDEEPNQIDWAAESKKSKKITKNVNTSKQTKSKEQKSDTKTSTKSGGATGTKQIAQHQPTASTELYKKVKEEIASYKEFDLKDVPKYDTRLLNTLSNEELIKVLIYRGLVQKNPTLSISAERMYCQLNRIQFRGGSVADHNEYDGDNEVDIGYPNQDWNATRQGATNPSWSTNNPYLNNSNSNNNNNNNNPHQRFQGGYNRNQRPTTGYSIPIEKNHSANDGPPNRANWNNNKRHQR